jgi:hypothetical protein
MRSPAAFFITITITITIAAALHRSAAALDADLRPLNVYVVVVAAAEVVDPTAPWPSS